MKNIVALWLTGIFLMIASPGFTQFDGGSGTKEDPYQISSIEQLDDIRNQKAEGGYTAFRSPAMVVTNEGTILAFTEGRETTWQDDGAMDDIIVKRSEDEGKTWGPIIKAALDKPHSNKNPAPVVLPSGRILLIYTWTEYYGEDDSQRDKREVHMTYSDDDGRTWSEPRNITSMVYRDDWGWYGTGPGHGIVKEKEPHKGRIIIPARHNIRGEQAMASHIIYSDDGGETWEIGAIALRDPKRSNESTAVELSNGDIMLNARTTTPGEIHRVVAISSDGGETFDSIKLDSALIEPPAQGSILKHSVNEQTGKYNILFSNPHSSEQGVRVNGTLKLSQDDGKTWSKKYQYSGSYPEFSGYNDIAVINEEGDIGILREKGRHYDSPIRWDGVVFHTVAFDDINVPINEKVEGKSGKDIFVFDSRDGHYILTNDIDASKTSDWNNGKGFSPIGNRSDTFTGYFDGNGHKIKNLKINRKDEDHIGLFGYAGVGEIENIELDNVEILGGGNNTGALVGFLRMGTLKNSSSSGKITGNRRVGGLVGYNKGGRIINSRSYGKVWGNNKVGGIVGQSQDGGSLIDSNANCTVFINGY